MENTHPKIIYSIDQMISDAILKYQYYGEFCQFINFHRRDSIRTCGVNVDIRGMHFFYNEDFLNEISQEEVNFVMIHEIFHLLWDHKSRERRCGYEHKLSNIVQDMIINEVIKTDIIDKLEKENIREKRNAVFAKQPTDRDINEIWILVLPIEYKGKLVYEEMYEWIVIEKKKYDDWRSKCKCPKSNKCICNSYDGKENCECGKCPISEYLRKIFDRMDMDLIDFLDVHLPSDIPDDYRKTIIDNIKNILENRGICTGDILATIGKINSSKYDYTKELKIGINELFGTNKQKSITKRNRRSIEGLKGKKKYCYALNVLLDVSGSMDGYFEKALSYVFQNDLTINLIQCDAEVKNFTVVKEKRDFNKIRISGLGGTVLQPGLNFIASNKELNKLNTLILTDGMCDSLDVKKLKKVLIISNNKEVKIIGKARQILIKD